MQSRIIQNDGITLSGGSGTATITIQAEDPSVSKTYTVNFVPQLLWNDSALFRS